MDLLGRAIELAQAWLSWRLVAFTLAIVWFAPRVLFTESPKRKKELSTSPAAERYSTALGPDFSTKFESDAGGNSWKGADHRSAPDVSPLDLFSCCLSRLQEDNLEISTQSVSSSSSRRRSAEYKFGMPRSELYATTYAPMAEDIDTLVKAVIPDAIRHKDIANNLRSLRSRAAGLPASGWLQPRDNRVLLRFLMARQGNVQHALDMLRVALEWREQTGAERALSDWNKEPHEAVDPYWKTIGFLGCDKDGDLVCYDRIGQCRPPSLVRMTEAWAVRHEIFTQECIMACLERARQRCVHQGRMGGYNITVVIDLEGLNASHADRVGLSIFKACTRIGADYYPEIVKRIMFIHAPWIFPIIWRIVKTFLDQGTVDKVTIVSEKSTKEALLDKIPVEHVPKALGGTKVTQGGDYCSDVVPMGGDVPDAVIERYFSKAPR
eukprot:TRINITY_DN63972_c0_g1_i1.p1 TRINITY_DN63972_c0_g1~~TRINITY_DN63972_c0_g1_i1.p1  ORF type:complete len:437 (+),score=63.77 TRINITY_DN63972_c0_g1_i1:47-1357(+)